MESSGERVTHCPQPHPTLAGTNPRPISAAATESRIGGAHIGKMSSCRFAVAALLALCLPPILALPNGAPLGVCGSMLPSHNGVSMQVDTGTHRVNASLNNGTVQVRIMGTTYRGLLIQARKPNGTVAIGTWSMPPTDTKLIKCFNRDNSAVTHSNTNVLSQDTVYTWNPPQNDCAAKVVFLATVAESREIYWVKLKSQEIEMPCSGAVRTMSGLAMVVIWSLAWLAAF